ncbi:Lar family restriction alleviation protein [Pseudomonas cichorii]|uniref:Lar family restriction alleviation protein n=1 Tax=Pseudomonas cichorii TaxID=36746 RepID=UPI001C897E59|nr:Lar family restriction alleviation protein [Pseudomonas cichorii]MBX8528500.1 Lar family restriction alleviation protein [Pseudomonas cichorii]
MGNHELKPCPFCGEIPIITKHFREEAYNFMHRCAVLGPVSWDFRIDRQSHIDKWNSRAALAAPVQSEREPLYQISDGVNGWRDVERLRYEACCLDPEQYECRIVYPAEPVQVARMPNISRFDLETPDGPERFLKNLFKVCIGRSDFDAYIHADLASDFAYALSKWIAQICAQQAEAKS